MHTIMQCMIVCIYACVQIILMPIFRGSMQKPQIIWLHVYDLGQMTAAWQMVRGLGVEEFRSLGV